MVQERRSTSLAEHYGRPASVTPTKRAQVRGILEQEIESDLSPGDAIPSERALVTRLGVSRVTRAAGRLPAAPHVVLPRDA
jgi:GntR family transcriptional regulator